MSNKRGISPLDEAIGTAIDLNYIVNDMFAHLSSESIQTIQNIESPSGMYGFHFNTGMAIRNNYGLWEDNPLTQWFNTTLGVFHADDMSGIIQEALWHRVHNLPFDPKPLIAHYTAHWNRAGLNLDQTPINKEHD